ncbi:unnamed protein product [Adineta steineri]|uniref:Uncharacterized protein n=1 Tax=Adineta steineri TaxID=433720 RepID=A0A815C9H4_9BILA|nr:unnamed protein product [Adineta steineri]CAF1281005.1 unnamed protein product [Adineta steineri]
MYNWESSMEDRIRHMRQEELGTLQRIYILRSLNSIHNSILIPLLALTMFGTSWLLDYPLNAVDCFTTLTFFGLLRNQIMFLMPAITERLTDVQGASKRIDAFMRSTATTQNQHSSKSSSHDLQPGHIFMSNASFAWSHDQPCLSSLNINIKSGTFVGIVGTVGAGKSSLLAAILGEMILIDGQLMTYGSSFSYAPQSAWLFADTIRNNILLNKAFDEQRYRDVIHACCLDVDLSLVGVAGDLTMVGERDVETKKETSELDNLINDNTLAADSQSIIAEEISVSGKANWSLWYRLFIMSPLGICGFCLLILLLIIGEIFYDGTNYWLRIWLKHSSADQQRFPTLAYIYFGLSITTIVADVLRVIFSFYIILHGTNNLHNGMLKGVLHTSIQFFESNPSGRILSRASKDQKILDEVLPTVLIPTMKAITLSVGSIVVICLVKPYILLVIVALIPFVLLLCRFYLRSNSQLKRLESATHSPIYDLLSSSLHGSVSVRAFRVQEHFMTVFTDRIDRNTRTSINTRGAGRWFAMRLNLLPFINTFATAILLVIYRHEIDSSLSAFLLMYAISIPKSFQLALQQLFEADLLMTSVERIYEYSQLPPEEDQGGHQRLINTSPNWPIRGTIDFRNYFLSHRAGLDPVLKNINIQIRSGEKIGIIGRTGAGKSSLFKGILRFIHRSNVQGVVLIDDIDISRITLQQLRSHLSIIPQQPVLFSDTLRYNLDPFNFYSDEQCWMALDDVQLKQFVSDHPMGLQMLITESGSNLSAGQCQLICIARAILKQSKILLIDEATSNVDQKTDTIIQTVIANKFRDRTVLTIAHRLNTIAQSDRILLLDEGLVVNFDTPKNILQQYQQPC